MSAITSVLSIDDLNFTLQHLLYNTHLQALDKFKKSLKIKALGDTDKINDYWLKSNIKSRTFKSYEKLLKTIKLNKFYLDVISEKHNNIVYGISNKTIYNIQSSFKNNIKLYIPVIIISILILEYDKKKRLYKLNPDKNSGISTLIDSKAITIIESLKQQQFT